MLYFKSDSKRETLSEQDIINGIDTALNKIGKREKILAVPPDITRIHSRAGVITRYIWKKYKNRLKDILPATGTHAPLNRNDIKEMFGDIPLSLFREHDWIKDTVNTGNVSANFVVTVTGGVTEMSWPCEVNRLIIEGGYDLILSIGQVVPHEVTGMSNYNKNILIGTGGKGGIDRSHYIGALHGIEKTMGEIDTPVRKILNRAHYLFLREIPIVYILTVIARDVSGNLGVRGLYIGDDEECFRMAAELSREVNISNLDHQLTKVVVYLNPVEYRSTWLGNKAIYRTRIALAPEAQLIVIAPGIERFGEISLSDKLIRKYGYCGRENIKRFVKEDENLASNLGVAAHLIHSSTEGRFSVVLCAGNLTKAEVQRVGYSYADCSAMMKYYNPEKLAPGFNTMDNGDVIYYIDNPALGLWKCEK
jgi:nickel-dependent lactate racemase